MDTRILNGIIVASVFIIVIVMLVRLLYPKVNFTEEISITPSPTPTLEENVTQFVKCTNKFLPPDGSTLIYRVASSNSQDSQLDKQDVLVTYQVLYLDDGSIQYIQEDSVKITFTCTHEGVMGLPFSLDSLLPIATIKETNVSEQLVNTHFTLQKDPLLIPQETNIFEGYAWQTSLEISPTIYVLTLPNISITLHSKIITITSTQTPQEEVVNIDSTFGTNILNDVAPSIIQPSIDGLHLTYSLQEKHGITKLKLKYGDEENKHTLDITLEKITLAPISSFQ